MDTPDIQSQNTTLLCSDYIDVVVDMDVVVKPVEWLRLLLTWDPERRPAPVNLKRSTLPQFCPLYMSLNYIWILEGEDCLSRSSSESHCSRFYREQYRDVVIAFLWHILIATLSQPLSQKSLHYILHIILRGYMDYCST